MKTEKIVICGPSGSGKNFLLEGLIEKGYKYLPKITTRPIREHEKDGLDYHFLKEDEYNILYENDLIKVYQKFKINKQTWHYAITKKSFDDSNVFIMTPEELTFLSKEERKKCFVVFLDIEEKIRRKRISKRNDNSDSIDRRILADRIDFKYFRDYDMKINDPEFEIKMVYDFAF
jgi:guanylate kinase